MGFYAVTVSEFRHRHPGKRWPLAVLVASDDGGEWILVHSGLTLTWGRTARVEGLVRAIAARARGDGVGAFPVGWATNELNWLLPDGLVADPPRELEPLTDLEEVAVRLADEELCWGTDPVVVTRARVEREQSSAGWLDSSAEG